MLLEIIPFIGMRSRMSYPFSQNIYIPWKVQPSIFVVVCNRGNMVLVKSEQIGGNSPEEKEGEKKVSEVETFLDKKVDFKLLRSLFADVVTRCGLDADEMNFLDRNRVKVKMLGISSGQFVPKVNRIDIDDPLATIRFWSKDHPSKIAQIEKEYRLDTCKVFGSEEIAALEVLIHEEGHAIGRQVCVGTVTPKAKLAQFQETGIIPFSDRGSPIYGQVGLSRSFNLISGSPESPYKGKGGTVFRMLNEAVNEKFARMITARYLDASGDFSLNEIEIFKRSVAVNKDDMGYSTEIRLLDLVISRISAKNEISEEQVMQSFFRAMIEGELFEDKDVQELFSDTFGPDFLRKLSRLSTTAFSGGEAGIEEFIREYIK